MEKRSARMSEPVVPSVSSQDASASDSSSSDLKVAEIQKLSEMIIRCPDEGDPESSFNEGG